MQHRALCAPGHLQPDRVAWEQLCKHRVALFVRAPTGRLSGELSARATRRIRFANTVTNVPPGQPKNLRLKLTRQGKRIAPMLIRQGTRKLRGFFEVRNSAGGIDIIPLSVRLR